MEKEEAHYELIIIIIWQGYSTASIAKTDAQKYPDLRNQMLAPG